MDYALAMPEREALDQSDIELLDRFFDQNFLLIVIIAVILLSLIHISEPTRPSP